jgi:hypothetical protein
MATSKASATRPRGGDDPAVDMSARRALEALAEQTERVTQLLPMCDLIDEAIREGGHD